jgi:hypothetical protein
MFQKLTKKMIPFYVWFNVGYGATALLISIVNFGMITLLTIKGMGIDAPQWTLFFLTVFATLCLTLLGFFFVRYNIQNQISEYQNLNMNPQITQISADVKWIKERLK